MTTHIDWSFLEFEVDRSDDDSCSHDQVYIFDADDTPIGPFCGFDDAFADPTNIDYDYNYDSMLGLNNLGDYAGQNSQTFNLRFGLITDNVVQNYGIVLDYSSSYKPCPDGFIYENEECVDADECLGEGTGHACATTDECVNSYSSYQCGCDDGFDIINHRCVDIDECATNSGGCTADSVCKNYKGTYMCECLQEGYGYNDVDGGCSDIDECADNTCSIAAQCTNMDPGYSCVCPDGFEDVNGDGSICDFSGFPTGWLYRPQFDLNHDLFISAEGFTSFSNMNFHAFKTGVTLLLCEEYFRVPYGIIKPGKKYACNDVSQRFTASRYTNQGGFDCFFNDYTVTCGNGNFASIDGYIARANQPTIIWDADTGNAYDEVSNQQGLVIDTGLSVEEENFDDAASICAAHGGQMFNEEVDMYNPASSFTDCAEYMNVWSKAHGRLKQIEKDGFEPGITDAVFTGYKVNDAGTDWCYFDGVTCHDTLSTTPIGAFIDPNNGWVPVTGTADCSISMIATAINNAIQQAQSNIVGATLNVGDCLLWDYSTDKYIIQSCTSKARFFCERPSWDCMINNGGCSDICNPAGYCECPDGEFLTAFDTCEPIPDLTGMECYPDRMVAYFSAADFTNAEDIKLLDETCDEDSFHIVRLGDRYRVEVKLDECGTTVAYDDVFETITFTNAISSGINMNAKINMKTRMNQEFSCVYSANVNIGDNNVNVTSTMASHDGENIGTFAFQLDLYTSDAFAEPAVGPFRVGEKMYFSISQNPSVSNTVFRATKCTVWNNDLTLDYNLWINGNNPDAFTGIERWAPFYFDATSTATCAAKDFDRYSYTVFEFIDQNQMPMVNSTVHVHCDIQVCVAKDDMTGSPCNVDCDGFDIGTPSPVL
ncbi:unnamed protein product [Oikopleura dioica]|uniref:ZP domain-containing protein n=1 Tax=Oikopleura dioica TaxID=34765 RepID=E4X7P7_OIKDI|nr:unnamed protein product [Oikopleura dioica]